MLDKLTDGFLALLGLDLNVSFSLDRDPFNLITEDVYLGARPEPARTSALKHAGITHVVSCLPKAAQGSVAFLRDEFQTVFVPMHDGIHEDIASKFPVFFDFVDKASQRHSDAKVLVHCEVGVSRSASLVIALVMKRRHQRFFEAYRSVRAKRPEILPNIGFASQLQQFEFDMLHNTQNNPPVSSLARYLKEVCMVPVEIETLESVLQRNNYNALNSIQAIFGEEIPRVIQGVRT